MNKFRNRLPVSLQRLIAIGTQFVSNAHTAQTPEIAGHKLCGGKRSLVLIGATSQALGRPSVNLTESD